MKKAVSLGLCVCRATSGRTDLAAGIAKAYGTSLDLSWCQIFTIKLGRHREPGHFIGQSSEDAGDPACPPMLPNPSLGMSKQALTELGFRFPDFEPQANHVYLPYMSTLYELFFRLRQYKGADNVRACPTELVKSRPSLQ